MLDLRLSVFLVEVSSFLLAEITKRLGKSLELLFPSDVIIVDLSATETIEDLGFDDKVTRANLVLETPSLLDGYVQNLWNATLSLLKRLYSLESLWIDLLVDLEDGLLLLFGRQGKGSVGLGDNLLLSLNVLDELRQVLVEVGLEHVLLQVEVLLRSQVLVPHLLEDLPLVSV